MSLLESRSQLQTEPSSSDLLTDIYLSTGYHFSIKDPVFSDDINDATKETLKPDRILSTLKETNKLTDEEYTMYARDIITVFETHAESECFDKKAAAHITKLWRELMKKLHFRAGQAETLEIKDRVRRPVTTMPRAPNIFTRKNQAEQSSYRPAQHASAYTPARITSTYIPADISPSYTPAQLPPNYTPAKLSPSYSPAELSSTYIPAELPSNYTPAEISPTYKPIDPVLYNNPIDPVASGVRHFPDLASAPPLIRKAATTATKPAMSFSNNRRPQLKSRPLPRTQPPYFGNEQSSLSDDEFLKVGEGAYHALRTNQLAPSPVHFADPTPTSSEDPLALPSITAKQRPPHVTAQPTPQSRDIPNSTAAMPKAMTADDEAFHYPARFPNKYTPWNRYHPVYPNPTSPFEIGTTAMIDDDLFFNFDHTYPVLPVAQRPFKHSKRSAAPTRWSNSDVMHGMTQDELIRGAETSVADELEDENEDKEWMVVQKEDGEEEWDVVERVSS
ncbi:hypothetical protein PMZ80_005541 [Knufia obscura]|uniref:Uncharacterized protein n=1 Tax=Knufia obscura TaxID=1635080 RepID=A0ABR0RLX7_9EURO|nr:hypothetical protein PMZ80_005541 [Knufia obscura]